jgi:hypothetical protein
MHEYAVWWCIPGQFRKTNRWSKLKILIDSTRIGRPLSVEGNFNSGLGRDSAILAVTFAGAPQLSALDINHVIEQWEV